MCDQAIEAIQRGDMLAAFDVWDEMLNGDVFPYHNLFHNFTGSNDCAPAPFSRLSSHMSLLHPLSLWPCWPFCPSVPLAPQDLLALLALLFSLHTQTLLHLLVLLGPSGPVARVHLAPLGLTALHGLQTTTC